MSTSLPENRGINTEQDDIILEPEILKPRLVPLLRMSNKNSNKHMVTLQVLGVVKTDTTKCYFSIGAFNEVDAIPELKKVAITDERPMIRATAYWAMVKFLGKKQEILSMLIMIKRMQKFRMK